MTDGRRSAAAARRRARETEIIAATRALFDEKGVREAQIEDIASRGRASTGPSSTGTSPARRSCSRSPW